MQINSWKLSDVIYVVLSVFFLFPLGFFLYLFLGAIADPATGEGILGLYAVGFYYLFFVGVPFLIYSIIFFYKRHKRKGKTLK